MGIEAVAKQAESRILIAGLGPLGVEIAKNIVLAGCKELILFDEAALVKDELCGQFFISEKDFENVDYNKSKAHFSKEKLQSLNFYVKVTVLDINTNALDWIKTQSDLKVAVFTDFYWYTRDETLRFELNDICRGQKTSLITAFQNGLFGRIFTDFGPTFTVLDKNGEDL